VPRDTPGNRSPSEVFSCPPGFILDKNLKLCVPESPLIQAHKEALTVKPYFRNTAKVEVTSVPFNNFFVVDGGKAIDKGNSRPKNAEPSDNNNFVLVVENKDGGNKVTNITAADKKQARIKAMNSAKKNSDSRVVILAQRVGTLDGKPLFKDIVGFKPKVQ